MMERIHVPKCANTMFFIHTVIGKLKYFLPAGTITINHYHHRLLPSSLWLKFEPNPLLWKNHWDSGAASLGINAWLLFAWWWSWWIGIKVCIVLMMMIMPVLPQKRKGRMWNSELTLCCFSLGPRGIASSPWWGVIMRIMAMIMVIVSCPDHQKLDHSLTIDDWPWLW